MGAAGAQQAPITVAALGVEASLLAQERAVASADAVAVGSMRPQRPGTATSSSTCWPAGMLTPAPASSSLHSASFAKTSSGALRGCAVPVAVGEGSTRREKTSTMRLPKASTLEEVAEAEAEAAAGEEEKAAALQGAA